MKNKCSPISNAVKLLKMSTSKGKKLMKQNQNLKDNELGCEILGNLEWLHFEQLMDVVSRQQIKKTFSTLFTG
jgi:hypothetical protein